MYTQEGVASIHRGSEKNSSWKLKGLRGVASEFGFEPGLQTPNLIKSKLQRVAWFAQSPAGYASAIPSWRIMPRSSLIAQCSATLPSATQNQCDCWAAKRSPVGGMPHSSPSCVPLHVP